MCKVTLFKNFNIVDEQTTFEDMIVRIRRGDYKYAIVPLRQMLAACDTKGYDIAKKALLAFTPSAMFEGGRKMQYMVRYSFIIVLDWDKLTADELKRLKEIICSCGYTLACFVSPSGNGLKVMVRVSTGAGEHLKTFLSVQRFYSELTGVVIDPSGKDITRLCFVSWDPEAYYNPKASVFDPNNVNSEEGEPQGPSLQKPIQPDTNKGKQIQPATDERKSKQPVPEPPSGTGNIIKIYKRCIKYINKNTHFSTGQRNQFIFRLALELRKAGVPEVTSLFLIQQDYNYNENEVKSTVKSAFLFDLTQVSNLGTGNKKGGYPNLETQNIVSLQKEYQDSDKGRSRPVQSKDNQPGKKKSRKSSFTDPSNFPTLYEMDRLYYRACQEKNAHAEPVNEEEKPKTRMTYDQHVIEEMISMIFDMRFNVLKGRLEWRLNEAGTSFRRLEDHHENSIFRWLHLHYQFIPITTLHTILTSNFSTIFHPIKMYFNSIRKWDKKTDYIGQLIETIKTEDDAYWAFCFRKWFVAYAMSLLYDDLINHTIVVFVGAQGVGKSSWMKKLVPDLLREYLAPGAMLAEYKDTQLMMSECALIILDELEALNRRDLALIKDLITRAIIQVRRPYARSSEYLPHCASFISSVNDKQILTDPTGTRRYLCSTALKIDYQHKVSIDGCMAQAIALGNSGFKYWFDQDEIHDLTDHNEAYMSKSIEEELIETWLRPITLEEWNTKDQFQSGRNIRLMKSADVALFLVGKTRITLQSYTNSLIGKIMTKLKFLEFNKHKGKFYIVRVLTDDEVDRSLRTLNDTETAEDNNLSLKLKAIELKRKEDEELPF